MTITQVKELKEEVARLQDNNEALKELVIKLSASKIELASSYRDDMRILDAMKERYSASYAQHIRDTPLPN